MSDALLAITGNLQKTMNDRTTAVMTALRAGTKFSSNVGKQQLRQDITRAGFPRRLATTVQDNIYPTRGLSMEPTALLYSKAPHIIAGHADGGTIAARAAQSLAVPIDNSPAANIRLRKGESRIEAFERRFGKGLLQVVHRPGQSSILVAKMRATSSGRIGAIRARKATKTRGAMTPLDGMVSVPVFTLVRSVNLKKRLNTRAILKKASDRHPARMAFELRRSLEESERRTAI